MKISGHGGWELLLHDERQRESRGRGGERRRDGTTTGTYVAWASENQSVLMINTERSSTLFYFIFPPHPAEEVSQSVH